LVLSFKRKNSWTAALEVAIRFGGMSLKCIYLVNSPKVKKIELVSKGSGCFKSSLKTDWQKLGKTELTNPKIRKRVMKSRTVNKKKKKKTAVRRQGASVKYD
jgi:hypothetical protein